MSDRIVYVYGTKSKIHLAVQHDGSMLTSERCNLDELAGHERFLADSLDDVPDTREMCERCFPSAHMQADAETVTLA